MNKPDQTHTTFVNCLRDWNDPYLHGQKQVKTIGCNRCENCGCRLLAAYSNDLNTSSKDLSNQTSTATPSSDTNSIKSLDSIVANQDYTSNTNSKLNKIEHGHRRHTHKHTKCTQELTRSKSSVNVPKTIDQCIKLAKSRPRPSSIRPRASPLSGLLINEAAVPCLKRQSSFKSRNIKVESSNSYSTDEKDVKYVNTFKSIERESITMQINETEFLNVEKHETSITSYSTSSTSLNNINRINNENTIIDTTNMNEIKPNRLLDSTSLFSSTNSLIEHNDKHAVFDDSLQEKSFDSDR